MTSFLIRDRREDGPIQEESVQIDGDTDWSEAAVSEGTLAPPEAGRCEEGSCPRTP